MQSYGKKKREEGSKSRFFLFFNAANTETALKELAEGDSVVTTRLTLGHCALQHGLALVGKMHPWTVLL